MTDLDKLRALAEAVRGGWYSPELLSNAIYELAGSRTQADDDAALICAMPPHVVIGLIEQIAAMTERAEKAERERDEAQRVIDRMHPCEDSQNEEACGECIACLRVGMDAAIASRNAFRTALTRAEAEAKRLREAMPTNDETLSIEACVENARTSECGPWADGDAVQAWLARLDAARTEVG